MALFVSSDTPPPHPPPCLRNTNNISRGQKIGHFPLIPKRICPRGTRKGSFLEYLLSYVSPIIATTFTQCGCGEIISLPVSKSQRPHLL